MLIHIEHPLVRQRLAEADHQSREVFNLGRQASLPDCQVHALLEYVGEYPRRFAVYLADIHRLSRWRHAASSVCQGPKGSGKRSQPA
ncbi:hypothetical protein D3C79_781930 [compost metagenome]